MCREVPRRIRWCSWRQCGRLASGELLANMSDIELSFALWLLVLSCFGALIGGALYRLLRAHDSPSLPAGHWRYVRTLTCVPGAVVQTAPDEIAVFVTKIEDEYFVAVLQWIPEVVRRDVAPDKPWPHSWQVGPRPTRNPPPIYSKGPPPTRPPPRRAQP